MSIAREPDLKEVKELKEQKELKEVSTKYLNRDLSWIEFNWRVLEEAQDPSTPLLERVKFLAIVSSNLDEFMSVRVAGLKDQIKAGYTKRFYRLHACGAY